MNIVRKIQEVFDAGNSWEFTVVIFAVSILILIYFMYKDDIFSQWGYEPIVKVPKNIQKLPIVQKWFNLTRGYKYDMHHEESKPFLDYFKPPTAESNSSTDCLLSGFAFLHMCQHFCLAFFCPIFVPWSFAYGIAWEIFEMLTHMHCTLDIFWNMCGCLLGLLLRSILFPFES